MSCEYCRQSTHHPSCPMSPDPPTVTTCRKCGEPITPGYEFARIDGLDYCEDCIDDMPYCELIPLLGGEWKTVQAGEKIQCVDCKCCDYYEQIPVGEEYGVIDGNIYCEECVDEIPYCDLIARAGHDWRMASEEDIYDGYDG